MGKNLYKMFYKDYFQGIDFSFLLDGMNNAQKEEIVKKNKVKLSERNKDILSVPLANIPPCKRSNCNFPMKVQYPGLLTGIGLTHEANVEGEFKLGIHLDYITGMPIIYGSTIKGICRAAFEEPDYIQSLFEKHRIVPVDIDELIKDIFDGLERDPEHDDKQARTKAYKCKSIYKRDVFFDAVIQKTDSKGRILCADYITPHAKDVLKDPVPISFVKIAPGCIMEFRFRLTDSLLTKENKLDLLYDILCDFGIGAKTAVGYGNIVPV